MKRCSTEWGWCIAKLLREYKSNYLSENAILTNFVNYISAHTPEARRAKRIPVRISQSNYFIGEIIGN